MSRHSIRWRLTAWYLAALTLAMTAAGLGSFWLMRESLLDAADANLRARVEGAAQFLDSMERTLTPAEMQDEFREFSELSLGETMVDVADEAGAVLHRPIVPGWMDLLRGVADPPHAGIEVGDGMLAGAPVRVATSRVVPRGHPYRIVAVLPMSSAMAALARFRWLLVALLPPVVFLAGVGGYWISRRALAPVDRMTQAVREVTLPQLDRRIEVPPADDELRRLAVTFNDMLARLEAAVADMSRLTAEAAHELRTPVALVRTTADIALSRDRSADEYRAALADVRGHAEHLSALVGDLLLLAREDAGVESAELATVDMAALVREVVQGSEDAARVRGVTIVGDRGGPPREVMGQAASLRRLVLILLDNAIKYSRDGDVVDVDVGEADSNGVRTAVIRVTDRGIGVDPADRPRVFDRFFRGARARGATEGSGLGLSIARTIVQRHGGTIRLDAGPHGQGCRVDVELPVGGSSGARRASE